MSHCSCDALNQVIKAEGRKEFLSTLEPIEVGNWAQLCKCKYCDQLWAVDEWEKYSVQLAIKISERTTWSEASEIQRKQFLYDARGGTEPIKCLRAGCEQNRLKGVMFCVEHFYELGNRE